MTRDSDLERNARGTLVLLHTGCRGAQKSSRIFALKWDTGVDVKHGKCLSASIGALAYRFGTI